MADRIIQLESGRLSLDIDSAVVPLEELCGFGSRRSRKRGFVFVSKVLGKHWPVRPSLMVEMHRRLAEKIGKLRGPVVFLGMAETATGLGQGVYEQWLRERNESETLYQNSTRYRLEQPRAFRFDEAHSHATEHFVYRPLGEEHRSVFESARSLVLLDDEISTGRTLTELAKAYHRVNPHLREVVFVCLTEWTDDERRARIVEEVGVNVRFVNLLRGSFRFEANEGFDPGAIPDVTSRDEAKDSILPRGGPRLGVSGVLDAPEIRAEWLGEGRCLVLGTGEFAYPPFRLALALEERGTAVVFQTTTRSPLMCGEDLRCAMEFPDNYHDDIPNFVYNLDPSAYDRILVFYETEPIPEEHDLCARVGGEVLVMR